MARTTPTIFNISLARFPMPAKLLFTAVLLTLGTGYIFAIGNIALKVGFAPDEVATKYYGNEASRQAIEDIEAGDATGEAGVEEGEEFSFDDLDDQEGMSDEPIVPIPTFETLVAEGHFHLFGYTSIFFLCGLVLLFAELPAMLKNVLIVAPFAASVLDTWSILLTRFVGPGFAWMLIISGMVMSLSFLLVFVIGIYQLWFLKNHEEPVTQ
ncbi:MAG: hypothetical protein HKN43_10975 [Rhodothermales bacterium]|nr:hypothetical protein [Rhodothermales bacterium]